VVIGRWGNQSWILAETAAVEFSTGMARIGMNPSKTKLSEFRPARVTVAILVHQPYQAGYYEHRLSVLKASLWSLRENTSEPYDLMIFDNGSGPETAAFLDGLLDRGDLAFLLRSERNIGKLAALQMIFPSAPGETVAYADDDFFYYPGWLGAQLNVLDTFPRVGMVSGYVVPSFFAPDRTGSNARFAEGNPAVEVETIRNFPQEWIAEWAESTGRVPEAAFEEESRFTPLRYTYQGVTALGAANHDQFLCRKLVLTECLPAAWSENLMGRMIELDQAVDRAGYLRLATQERTVQHIGNVISPELARQLPPNLAELATDPGAGDRRTRLGRIKKMFLLWRPVRWLLLGIYSHLFRWINP